MTWVAIFAAKYLIFMMPLLMLGLWPKRTMRYKGNLILGLALAIITALLLIYWAGLTYWHPRPFVVQGIEPLVPQDPSDNGFPSTHTGIATAMAIFLWLHNRRLGIFALILAVAIGLARVYGDVHHGIDIAGGLVVGLAAGAIGYWLAKYLVPNGQKATVKQKHD